ncbi:MAG: LysM peptidoglycan-binding domain-containing protein [Lachnospiraceae bacterium]|nr:LysM peptidoglycan-binding domain-containing protein [Lachnospiraceae bacterium]MDE6128583.1 LysM peptidoglycan-binding domain-containing protein [Lachnospiraceae bacterium]
MDERVYEAFLNSEYRKQRNKMKRLRHFRRQCFLVLFTVLLILLLTVSYHAILSKATSDEPVSYKYYTSIEISYGDSLWSIADKYAGKEYATADDYVHEVMEINHLKEASLIAGQYLVIPYYSTEFK